MHRVRALQESYAKPDRPVVISIRRAETLVFTIQYLQHNRVHPLGLHLLEVNEGLERLKWIRK